MTKLAPEELNFFKEEGYLIKRKVMDESLMALARERLWENAPPEIDRDNPGTWVGPIKEYGQEQHNKGDEGSGCGWWYRGIGCEDWMVRMLVTHPPIWDMVEQMLGKGTVAVPNRVRGIHCRLPEGNIPCEPHSFHTDAHVFHLGVVGYIDDVPPNGGGFSVWPKSHRVFYYSHQTQHRNDRTERYAKHRAFLNLRSPIDCHGRAGDIIFWHHRLAHSAGNNRSREIRKAVLGDLGRIDIEHTMNEPPCEDMWRDWPGIPSDVEP